MDERADSAAGVAKGTVAEVFRAFLKLGLTSFGGPIAHLGYFRTEIVERRRWLDERTYADLVALAQGGRRHHFSLQQRQTWPPPNTSEPAR